MLQSPNIMSNIVYLNAYKKFSKIGKESGYDELHRVWREAAQTGAIPTRGEIKISKLRKHSKNLFLFKKLTNCDVNLTLHGHELTDVFGHDLLGLPMSTLFSATSRFAFRDIVYDLFTHTCPRRLELLETCFSFKGKLKVTLGLFPLSDDTGKVTQGIGIFIPTGKIKKKDYRFDIMTVSSKPKVISI